MPDTSALKVASDVLAYGRQIQGGRIRAISENIANADSVPTSPSGTPYARKIAVFQPVDPDSPRDPVGRIARDSSDFRRRYDPSNAAADRQGYVRLPNVNVAVESADLQTVIRNYELNLSASASIDSVAQATLNLLG
ncbi:flagellar biosynthesis protein FlgC [Methylobacterium sp. J-048]|uniref:flagellar basal body rod C-terminal domain-containing protein n=1 Tax=Methylobacterium sp. J-048 TaxID=2836635 RepID=UPI001FBA58AD|nr:flagellar basal body rod C-terminal domain-containing protein [Methylobacterium sp. J-048]MCJ2058806.1 flagellar biosynthesis protein FlgC [Methylobacterium sp. J-048]